MTQSIVGNLRIVGEFDGARMRAGFEAARRSTNTFSRSAQRDLNRTTRSVENLRRASSRPMFAGGFVAASRSLQTMNQRAEFLQTSMLALTAIFGGFTAAITGNALMRYADSFTEIGNRVRVVTDSVSELNAVQGQLFDVAQRSRSGLRETTILYGRMAVAGRQLGTSQADLLRITETIQKAFLVGGSTTTEASSSAIQLSQGIASNRLGGDELRSVLENQALGQLLADQIAGGSIARFRKMAEAGELTADVIMGAFLNASDAIDEAFTQIRPTISQSFVVLDNALMQYIGAADQASGTSELFAQAVLSLAKNLDTIVPALGVIGASIIGAFAGPKLAAIVANSAAFTANVAAQRAALAASVDLARQEAIAANARRASSAAALQSAQAVASSYAMQATAANASAAATQRAVLAQQQLAGAQAQMVAASRAAAASSAQLTASQGALAASSTVAGASIARLSAGMLAFVGGPVGAGILVFASGLYLLSLRQTQAERAAEAHKEAMDELDAAMLHARGGTQQQIADTQALAEARVIAAGETLDLAEAEIQLARARYASAQDPESSLIMGAQMDQAQTFYNQSLANLEDARSRLDEVLSPDFTNPGGGATIADVMDDAATSAQRLAQRLEELRLTSMASGLDEIDRQTVQTALSFDVATDAVERFIAAARSGDMTGVDSTIMDIRSALELQQAYQTTADVLEQLRTVTQDAAEYQQQLNLAVERGGLTADQAAEAYRRYMTDLANNNEVLTHYKDLTKSFITDMVDGLREGESIWESFGNAAANALDKIAERLLDIAIDNTLNALFGQAMGTAMGGSKGGGGGLLGGLLGLFPSFDGGGYTGSGARSGGLDGRGGFAAIIHPNEMVHDLTRGGMPAVNDNQSTSINMYVDINGSVSRAEAEEIAGAMAARVRAEIPGTALKTYTDSRRAGAI